MRFLIKGIVWLLLWPILLPIWLIKLLVRGRPRVKQGGRSTNSSASPPRRSGRLGAAFLLLLGGLFVCGVIGNLAPKQQEDRSSTRPTTPARQAVVAVGLATSPGSSETHSPSATPSTTLTKIATTVSMPSPSSTAPATATSPAESNNQPVAVGETPTAQPADSAMPTRASTATPIPSATPTDTWTTTPIPTATTTPVPTSTPTSALGVPAEVVRITDGDTIEVRIAGQLYPLRYIGIDTPETGQPFAAEATARNRELVAGKILYLQKDVSETDQYNRLLRYAYLADGTFVNLELVRQGYALAVTYPPDVQQDEVLRQAQQEATNTGRGLWQLPVTNKDANLRGGPGTDYPVVGGLQPGQVVAIIAQNEAGDWYQLDNQTWIAAFLVDRAPAALAVAAVLPTLPPPPPATPTPVPPDQQEQSIPPLATPTPVPPAQPDQPTPAPLAPVGGAA
jgi:endonuclease YncB( thermonuclease family)